MGILGHSRRPSGYVMHCIRNTATTMITHINVVNIYRINTETHTYCIHTDRRTDKQCNAWTVTIQMNATITDISWHMAIH